MLSEIIISWSSLPHDFHMIRAHINDSAVDKESGTKELARTIKIQGVASGVAITEKKINQTSHIDITGPQGHF